jgi:hypothetical protein
MSARFIGRVLVEWLSEEGSDRKMKLVEDFAFEDEAGLRWDVPSGAVIDGASIPQIFWTSFGPPFVGDYRRASVVHDHYCIVKTRPSKAVHRMFREACEAGGVSRGTAKLMYLAVRTFGPNWKSFAEPLSVPGAPEIAAATPIEFETRMDMSEYESLKKWIETEDPDIDAIDAMIEEKLISAPIIPGFSIEQQLAPTN